MGNIKLANMLRTLAGLEMQQYEMDKTMEALRYDSMRKTGDFQSKIRNREIAKRDAEDRADIGFWRLLGKTLLVIVKTFLILAGVGIALVVGWTVLSFITLGMLYRFLEKIVYFSIFLPFAGTAVVAVAYVIGWILIKFSSKPEVVAAGSDIERLKQQSRQIDALYQQQLAQIEQEKARFVDIAIKMKNKLVVDFHVSVYYKYDNPVALSKIAEYLESGRCDTLEGPHGAYNLYESEVRMNAIIEKLDDVAKNLEKVRQGQFALYQGMQTMMNRVNAFSQDVSAACDRMESLEKNVKLQTYYNELHARQQEYTNYALGVRSYGTGFVTYR